MLYADVCVNSPLGRRTGVAPDAETDTFTYAVPDRLAGRVQPGHLVWVPFRGRRLQAVVLRLTDAAPTFDTYEIVSLVWADPVLTPAQIVLAYWVRDYYVAPLIESLLLMLPVGLSQRGRTVFARTARPAPSGLTPTQMAVLARIDQKEGDWDEISEGLRGVTQRADLAPLVDRGLVTREVSFPSAPPRPKTDRQVRLLADAESIARVLPTLGRGSKQADVMAWLARAGEGGDARAGHRLKDVCAAAGCGEGPVRALAERGWVTIERPTAKGPVIVNLALASGAVIDALVTLRGAEKHRAVLEALQGQGGTAWIGWVYAQTDANLDTLRDLEAAGLVTIAEEMIWRDPLAGYEFALDQPLKLTDDQERVWAAINQRISRGDCAYNVSASEAPGFEEAVDQPSERSGSVFLLHGVTGSGKTEIYLRAIAEVLKSGKQAIALVPEIALTPQTIRRFAARFPGQVTVWHSELADGERFDVWRRVRTDHPAAQVVVGSRSALFLPFPRLGLIVLDEEHESSYKQERTPRYHARTAAVELGRITGAPVILGSATPALETYFSARRGEIGLLSLPQRIRTVDWADLPSTLPFSQSATLGDLPPVSIIDMRQELRAGNRSMFSRALAAGLRHVLQAGQQAILYLNRRGAATFVMCRDCGHVEACPRCAIPLTFHSEGEALVCHHCNRRYPAPITCAECGGRRIRYFGTGTERVEEAVRLEFPSARTLRWDRDVTGAKGSHDAILSKFVAHEADVLIGTQMIAKGLDLPLVTLVGVVAADTALFLPDFRAAERTFQLLTQVAGRAGRSTLGGEVIVQTYHPDHYAIVAAGNHDYDAFYRQEMAFRRQQGYPPVKRLARLVYYNSQRAKAQAESTRLAEQLRGEITRLGLGDTDLIGPAPCFFSQQRGEFRWQIVVRSPDPAGLLRQISPPPGWRLDIDPVDML
jgi:primosomal protein N' (replication factor Y) (superfamily II helicase)